MLSGLILRTKELIIIRVAKVTDADLIAKIIVSCWQNAYTGIVDPAYPVRLSVDKFTGIFKNIILDSKQTVFVYEENGTVIGFISGILNSGKYDAEVKGLYIKPENQGNGIGRELLKYMKQFFVSTECKTMIIWTLFGAKNNTFYMANGGVATKRKLLQIGNKQYDGVGFSYNLTSDGSSEPKS